MNLQAPFRFEVNSTVRIFIIGKDRLVRNFYSVFFRTIPSLSPLLLSPYLTWRLLFGPGTLCQLLVVKLEDILSKRKVNGELGVEFGSSESATAILITFEITQHICIFSSNCTYL